MAFDFGDFFADWGDTIFDVAGLGSDIYFADKAADIQQQSSAEALALEREMYQQGRADIAPWREAGGEAITDVNALIKGGPGEFEESPGYQFTLDEGQRGIERAMSATGRLGSGAHLRAGTEFAEGMASTEYDNFLRRWRENELNPRLAVAGMGQTAGQQTASMGADVGRSANRNALYQGEVGAGRQVDIGNALSRFLSSVQIPGGGGGGGRGAGGYMGNENEISQAFANWGNW